MNANIIFKNLSIFRFKSNLVKPDVYECLLYENIFFYIVW